MKVFGLEFLLLNRIVFWKYVLHMACTRLLLRGRGFGGRNLVAKENALAKQNRVLELFFHSALRKCARDLSSKMI
jgi:hypothetical protein